MLFTSKLMDDYPISKQEVITWLFADVKFNG